MDKAVSIDDLNNVLGLCEGVDNTTSETDSIIKLLIENFAAGGRLSGDAWNSERTKLLDSYSPSLTNLSNLSKDVKNTIDGIVAKLKNAMGDGCTYLNCSDIEELEIKRNNLIARINSIQKENLSTMKKHSNSNVAISVINYRELKYLDDNLYSINLQIEKLKNFEKVLSEAKAELNDLMAKIVALESAVDNIQPSKVLVNV